MRFKRRAVSPIIAVILLIGLTVLAAATVAFVVIGMLGNEDASIMDVTNIISYDYNNDGRIDAMILSVVNGDADTDQVKFISLEKWYIAPGYDKEISSYSEASIMVITSLVSAQFDPNIQLEIGVSSTTKFNNPSTLNIGSLNIPDPTLVEVMDTDGEPMPGQVVFFRTESGGVVNFQPTASDVNGHVTAYLMPNYYRAHTQTGLESELFHNILTKSVIIEMDTTITEQINVKVIDGNNDPIEGLTVYDADTSQNDLGQSAITGLNGVATFYEPQGSYLFHTEEYLSSFYWSSTVTVPSGGDGVQNITIKIGSDELIGRAMFGDLPVGNGKLLRLYSANNVSAGKYDYTNSTSHFEFTAIPSGLYRLRLDYQSSYFWSRVISTSDINLEVDFGGGTLTVLVTAGGAPLPNGVLTRLYRSDNVSAGRYDYLNSSGYAEYGATPTGSYRLRVDWLSRYIYTTAFTNDGTLKTVDVGGGSLDALVTAGGAPLPNGVLTRLYREDNVSAGRYDYLNSTGWAEYGAIPEGNYRLRIDWLSRYIYTTSFNHDGSPQYLDIGGGALNVLVTAGGAPLPNGVLTRLYREDNVSAGRYDYLNSTGWAEYGAIPDGNYRLRVDWLSRYILTVPFYHNGSSQYLDIGGGTLDILVTAGGSPLPSGVLTRLYRADNVSAGRYDYLNSTGWAEYGAIPDGNYRLRIDWLSRYIFTTEFYHNSSSSKYLDVDGGSLNILVTAGGEPLPNGVLTRLYRADNVSAGRYDYLNNTGWAEYGAIPEGNYRLRIDWLSQYIFTTEFTNIGSSPIFLDLPGGKLNVHLTIDGISLPNGVLTRLYRADNVSAGRYDYLNNTGWAEYGAIPQDSYQYRLRIDWMSKYYWTTPFDSDGSTIEVSLSGAGLLTIQVQDDSTPLGNNQLVYLYHYNGVGSYSSTGRYDYTDVAGTAVFTTVPAGNYVLRWGSRYSEMFVVTITASIDVNFLP